MTVEELAKRIGEWEQEAGESFTDYFMHDRVRDNSWAFWLLGKGYSERANAIIVEILEGRLCIDQQALYNLNYHPNITVIDGFLEVLWEDEYMTSENYNKDILLWAEFLLATPFYTEKITKWLKEQE